MHKLAAGRHNIARGILRGVLGSRVSAVDLIDSSGSWVFCLTEIVFKLSAQSMLESLSPALAYRSRRSKGEL